MTWCDVLRTIDRSLAAVLNADESQLQEPAGPRSVW